MSNRRTHNYRTGDIVKAKVSGITKYGIFVKVDEKYTGLIHISSMSEKFVKDPNTFTKVNDVINVEILDIDKNTSKMKLSIKNLRYKDKKINNRKVIETAHGFDTLKRNLPFWIDKNLKSAKKKKNFIDK